MQTVRKGYNYFESLENTVKTAFAAYLVFFVSGMILTLLGAENVLTFLQTHSALFSVIASVFILAIFFGLMFTIGKINWLGDLHIKLDRRFFGFLERSNDIIFRTLISALKPHEQQRFLKLPPEKKGTITQSIFSHLSDDKRLFEKLLHSGIFRIWIWYWVSIYGTFAFTLLTVSSFLIAWIQSQLFSIPFFTINWILALFHLFVSVLIVKYLLEKTKKTVQLIVAAHQFDIANVSITRIHDEPEVNEGELYQESDSDM